MRSSIPEWKGGFMECLRVQRLDARWGHEPERIPLTPALSPREREKCASALRHLGDSPLDAAAAEARGARRRGRSLNPERRRRVTLSRRTGEGWGEGARRTRRSMERRPPVAPSHCRTVAPLLSVSIRVHPWFRTRTAFAVIRATRVRSRLCLSARRGYLAVACSSSLRISRAVAAFLAAAGARTGRGAPGRVSASAPVRSEAVLPSVVVALGSAPLARR